MNRMLKQTRRKRVAIQSHGIESPISWRLTSTEEDMDGKNLLSEPMPQKAATVGCCQ